MLPAFFRVSSAAGRDRTKPFLPEGNGLAAEGQPADPVRSCCRTQQRETVPPGVASAAVSAGDSKQIWH